MSSMRNSGSIRKPSGVSAGRGRLCDYKCQSVSVEEATRPKAVDVRDRHPRMLLPGIDLAHEPSHDKVGKADTAGQILRIEQLDLISLELTAPSLALLLQGQRSQKGDQSAQVPVSQS